MLAKRSSTFRKGTYQVDCYIYLPCATALELHAKGEEFLVAKWWRESRHNENYPDWILREVLLDEECDTEEQLERYWQPRIPDLEDATLQNYLYFVIHLQPEGDQPAQVSPPESYGTLAWQPNHLEQCPLGVRTDIEVDEEF